MTGIIKSLIAKAGDSAKEDAETLDRATQVLQTRVQRFSASSPPRPAPLPDTSANVRAATNNAPTQPHPANICRLATPA